MQGQAPFQPYAAGRPLTAEFNGKYLIISGKIFAKFMDVGNSAPGKKKWVGSSLWLQPKGQVIRHFINNLPTQINWEESTHQFLEGLGNADNAAEVITSRKHLTTEQLIAECGGINYEFGTKPFDHQLRAFMLSRDVKAFGLFMEMGTGKTKVLIDTAIYLFLQVKITQVLIVAPKGVHRQWLEEQFPVHAPKGIKWISVLYSASKAEDVEEKINRLPMGYLKILAMNVDAFSTDKGRALAMRFCEMGETLMIVDESSRIKHMSSKRTDGIIMVGKLCTYRRIATGTPITQGPMDIQSQFNFLDENILGMPYMTDFRNYYCVMGGWENKQVKSYKNMEELQQKIDAYSYRVLKVDCLDLPERMAMNRIVEFHPDQFKIYQDLKKNFITETQDGHIISGALAITRIMRLHQILCGHATTEEKEHIDIPTNRAAETVATLEEIGDASKTIIWAKFRPDVTLLGGEMKKADMPYLIYAGNDSQRAAALQQFKDSKTHNRIIMNPATGGIGLNINEAEFKIWYSYDMNLEIYLQAMDRNHRAGQTKRVTDIYMKTEHSIDDFIVNNLQGKIDVATMLVDLREILATA